MSPSTGSFRRALIGSSMIAVLIAGSAVSAIGQNAPGAPAQVVDFEPPARIENYKVTEFGKTASARDDRVTKSKFRVLERTGNCCENYITISPEGRLFDLGGSYINYTDDDGKTWKSVRPIEPLVNGEGTIAVAPGGDIVGVEWDAYTADHLLAYKYDADTEEWQYLEMPLKTPFYDRPWLSVIPGPFEGLDVPYVVFIDGYPHQGPLLYSTDGLTYTTVSNPFVDGNFEESVQSWVKTKPDTDLDWILPNSQAPITPLGAGRALAPPGAFNDTWSVLNPATQKWAALTLPDGELSGKVLADAKGRLHNLISQGSRFKYRISTDGAKSFKDLEVVLPEGHSSDGMQVDFRFNNKAGIAVVALHATTKSTDRDLLYKIDISKNTPRLVSLYEIGLGDINASSGVGQQIRFDFNTVAIFPDGRLAVSFLDSSTGPIYHLAEAALERLGPALAIEL